MRGKKSAIKGNDIQIAHEPYNIFHNLICKIYSKLIFAII